MPVSNHFPLKQLFRFCRNFFRLIPNYSSGLSLPAFDRLGLVWLGWVYFGLVGFGWVRQGSRQTEHRQPGSRGDHKSAQPAPQQLLTNRQKTFQLRSRGQAGVLCTARPGLGWASASKHQHPIPEHCPPLLKKLKLKVSDKVFLDKSVWFWIGTRWDQKVQNLIKSVINTRNITVLIVERTSEIGDQGRITECQYTDCRKRLFILVRFAIKFLTQKARRTTTKGISTHIRSHGCAQSVEKTSEIGDH